MLDKLLKEFDVTTPAELFTFMENNPNDPRVMELHEILELALIYKGTDNE
jgi:hypothetical protein